MSISYFNNTVAIGSGHRDIIILDVITGSQTAILSGHTDEVLSVVFSSDGRSLVSGSVDMTVKLWDMQTGGAIKTFSGHTEDGSLCFHFSGLHHNCFRVL
jgi:WD40 repeat protein